VTIDFGTEGGPGGAPTGRVLPPSLLDGFLTSTGVLTVPNSDEQAIVAFRDSDPDTIDIFYVDQTTEATIPLLKGVAYPAVRNATGDSAFQGFVVLSRRRNALTIAHEIMHVLLNSAHRVNEPRTALLHPTDPGKDPDKQKRMGPYPDAQGAGVGVRDTETVRSNAETLPR
jgi:hypothetical protein